MHGRPAQHCWRPLHIPLLSPDEVQSHMCALPPQIRKHMDMGCLRLCIFLLDICNTPGCLLPSALQVMQPPTPGCTFSA